jgi:hypothetical protein
MIVVKCPVCGSREIKIYQGDENFECKPCGCVFDSYYAEFEEVSEQKNDLKNEYEICLENDIVIKINNEDIFNELLDFYKDRFVSYRHITEGMCCGCINLKNIIIKGSDIDG